MPLVTHDELDDEHWLFLHQVRLRGVVDIDGSSVVRVEEAGLVARVPKGFRLTPTGRDQHQAWARVEPGGELEGAVERAYQRFLGLNRELIRVCSDWQVRPGGVPNDHRDPGYDWAIVDRVDAIDDRVGPIVSALGRALVRFADYRPRLRAARRRVDAGESDWLTSPRIDSYHTVWMQLHEDLLLALGRERSSEAPGAGR
jgi:hypothetical protein